MLARLTTNVELLMLALDVLVEAEQLVSLIGAGVVMLVCVYGRGSYIFLTIYQFSE